MGNYQIKYYAKKRDLYNQRSYEIVNDVDYGYHLITLDMHKFNQEELNFIDELIKSLDKDNIILANQIILSKYE